MATNHKYEAAQSSCRRFWQAAKDDYYQQGLAAADESDCPYPYTSFAAIHWRRGAADRERNAA
ncbi:MAG: hypothetical protein SCI25_00100 [Desulfuromonadales bacterium]|nr:hypothetical protein [Desulfuromonadales bacterium]